MEPIGVGLRGPLAAYDGLHKFSQLIYDANVPRLNPPAVSEELPGKPIQNALKWFSKPVVLLPNQPYGEPRPPAVVPRYLIIISITL
jgi:hypothetical protein